MKKTILYLLVFVITIQTALAVCNDTDSDGYGNPGDATCANGALVDCNDTNSLVNPGQPHDYCSKDSVDYDCDGTFENGADTEKPEPLGAFFADLEGMKYVKGGVYSNIFNSTQLNEDYCFNSSHVTEIYCCVPGANALACGKILLCENGCFDGACVEQACIPETEVCDGVDNDCDGEVDEGGIQCLCTIFENEYTLIFSAYYSIIELLNSNINSLANNISILENEYDDWSEIVTTCESGNYMGNYCDLIEYIPLQELKDLMKQYDYVREIVTTCKSGNYIGDYCDFISSIENMRVEIQIDIDIITGWKEGWEQQLQNQMYDLEVSFEQWEYYYPDLTTVCNLTLDLDNDNYGFPEDCNDINPEINFDAPEICDGIDNDCDGSVDEGAVCDVPIACGDTITIDTTLYSDLSCLGDGLILSAPLDCQGHIITGNGFGTGIQVIGVYEAETFMIENCNVQNFSIGISLNSTTNIELVNNTVTNNDFGIRGQAISTTTFNYNIAENNTEGFSIVDSSDINFISNTIQNNIVGIRLQSTNKSQVINNLFSNNIDGIIYMENRRFTTISNIMKTKHDAAKNAINNIRGDGGTVANNTIENYTVGISVTNSSNQTIANNTVIYNGEGIHIDYSSNNTITDNTIQNNTVAGIVIMRTNRSDISGNNVTNSDFGMILVSSSGNSINLNNVQESIYDGIVLIGSSSNNIITENSLLYSTVGIHSSNSSGSNVIRGNIVTESRIGIQIEKKDTFTQNVEEASRQYQNRLYTTVSNIMKAKHDTSKSAINNIDRGDNDVTDNDIENNSVGISIDDGNNETIENNTVINNTVAGIVITDTSNSLVAGNTINNNFDGISVSGGSLNSFDNNKITDNTNYGINLQTNTNQNTFINNFFSNNGLNAFSLSPNTNIWSTSTLGNVWSDYQTNIGYPNYYQIDTNNLDLRPNFMDISLTLLEPLQTTTQTVYIYSISTATFTSIWLGSDVVMTLITPSGRIINRSTNASDITHINTPTSEIYEIDNPEEGDWDIQLFGADLPSEGEDVEVSVLAMPGDFDDDGYPNDIDCDDTEPTIYPGAVEVCDNIDNDCDGTVDDADEDNDGLIDCFGDDKCLETVEEQIIYGCSCSQILELKPGKDKGGLKKGCSSGLIEVFTKRIGWAKGLFE